MPKPTPAAVADAEKIAGAYIKRSDFMVEYALNITIASFFAVFIALFPAFAIPLPYGYSLLIVLSALLLLFIPLARQAARRDARLGYEEAITKLSQAISYFDPLIGTQNLTAMLQDKDTLDKLPWHANSWESLGKKVDPPTFDAVFALTAAKGNFAFAHSVDGAINERSQKGWATLGDIQDVLPEALRLCLARNALTKAGLRTALREILYTDPTEAMIRRANDALTADHDL